MRDKLFKIGLYTVNYVLENFESVHILGMYKYTLFEILKALSRDGNDFRIWMIWKQWQYIKNTKKVSVKPELSWSIIYVQK